MKNYQNSDYALNKINKHAIVYRFANEIVEVMLTDYLSENPNKTKADFLILKELSDADYLEQDRREYRQTWKNVPLYYLDEAEVGAVPSPEDDIINQPERIRQREQRRKLAAQVLKTLSVVQQRRYLLHVVDGLTTREIAEKEGVGQRSVMDSIEIANRKIEKFLNRIQK